MNRATYAICFFLSIFLYALAMITTENHLPSFGLRVLETAPLIAFIFVVYYRLVDAGQTRWATLICFIPFINLIFYIWLVFLPTKRVDKCNNSQEQNI